MKFPTFTTLLVALFVFSHDTFGDETSNSPDIKPTLVLAYLSYYKMDRLKHFYTGVYNELGYQVSFVEMPINRRLKALDSGLIDGIFVGSPALRKRYPNLVLVPPAITVPKLMLVCSKRITRCNASILDDETVDVYASSGSLRLYTVINGDGVASNVIVNENEKELQEVAAFRDVDYALITVAIETETPIIEATHTMVEVGEVPLFHYVHKNHESLKPGLTQLLETHLYKLRSFLY